MFTGIIEMTGEVVSRARDRLTIVPERSFPRLAIGESISVNGVCLTGESRRGKQITFRLLPETVRVTTLGSLRGGDPVNLERSLKVGDRLGGHLLLGHVDGQGKVVRRVRKGKSLTLEIEASASLIRCLVPKGPIGLDGVSLTLGEVSASRRRRVPDTVFQVHLIPHTARATTLGSKPVGGKVNIELDLVAKYLHRVLY